MSEMEGRIDSLLAESFTWEGSPSVVLETLRGRLISLAAADGVAHLNLEVLDEEEVGCLKGLKSFAEQNPEARKLLGRGNQECWEKDAAILARIIERAENSELEFIPANFEGGGGACRGCGRQ